MATTTNYSWTTPDDPDLVKDGAAAIRTLGSSVDTTTKNLNPQTTTGALAYRSATANVNTALPIGTAGQVLQVNSGATAPEWAAAPAAGANWSLLNAGGTALTGAQTITISGISGKDKIFGLFVAASSVNSGDYIGLRLNTDSAAHYRQSGGTVQGASTYSAGIVGTFDQTGATFIYVGEMSNNAGSFLQGYVDLSGCNSSGVKAFTLAGGCFANGGTGHRFITGRGIYDSSSLITSVSAFSNSSNFDAGTIFVYTSA